MRARIMKDLLVITEVKVLVKVASAIFYRCRVRPRQPTSEKQRPRQRHSGGHLQPRVYDSKQRTTQNPKALNSKPYSCPHKFLLSVPWDVCLVSRVTISPQQEASARSDREGIVSPQGLTGVKNEAQKP